MSELDRLIAHHPLPTWRPLALGTMMLVAGLLAWASVAELDEVAVAHGQVTPQGQVRLIQHLEGGILRRIMVQDGSVVQEGDVLAQLDLPVSLLNRDELQVRLDGAVMARARFLAESAAATILELPAEQAKRQPEIAAAEREAFQTRRRQLDSTITVLREQVRQRELDASQLRARRQSLQNDLRLAEQRLAISSDLVKDGLTSRLEHLQIERDVSQLRGDLAGIEPAISRAVASATELREREREEINKFRNEAQSNLARIEVEIARNREILAQASDQVLRTEIRSPIQGQVKNLRFTTIGGVLKPGEVIMEIVPLNENLVIESRLNPMDRGYVRVGQPARVKISTYDFVRYGGLDGKVLHISADADTDQRGTPYFRVIVQTDKAYLGDEPGVWPISPGMQAAVDIHTGRKTVLEYLIRPVLKLRHEALRER
ncbi:MAG: HlyD family type I secretion periplasmic adaptor subunit [Alphaproteobacteria bacterium]|nr:HlyD family type I secretion periplasmic adaptor subunit [Alphaproteobacteria bacterium]